MCQKHPIHKAIYINLNRYYRDLGICTAQIKERTQKTWPAVPSLSINSKMIMEYVVFSSVVEQKWLLVNYISHSAEQHMNC